MDPVIPPERIATNPTRREAHSNSNYRYYACHIYCDPHELRIRIVWSIAEIGLCSKNFCAKVSGIQNWCCDIRTKRFIKRAFLQQAWLQDRGRVLGVALALKVEKTATYERQLLCDTFKLPLLVEFTYSFETDCTPHGGILANASVAASGAAAAKLRALAHSAIATARYQNITEYREGSWRT
jgi:hypothetical protein